MVDDLGGTPNRRPLRPWRGLGTLGPALEELPTLCDRDVMLLELEVEGELERARVPSWLSEQRGYLPALCCGSSFPWPPFEC